MPIDREQQITIKSIILIYSSIKYCLFFINLSKQSAIKIMRIRQKGCNIFNSITHLAQSGKYINIFLLSK